MDIQARRKDGMNGYVAKPVNPPALAAELERWLPVNMNQAGRVNDKCQFTSISSDKWKPVS